MKPVYHMSSVGGCPRAVVAQRLGYDQVLPPEFMRRAAREGQRHEEWVAQDLAEHGWTASPPARCESCGRDGIHVEIDLRAYLLVGHLDRTASAVVDGHTRLVEIKSLGRFRAEKLARSLAQGTFKDDFREYAMQVSCYHHATGLPILYVVKNRDTGKLDLFEMPPPFSMAYIDRWVLNLEVAARRGILPQCEYRARDFERTICHFKYLCAGDAGGVGADVPGQEREEEKQEAQQEAVVTQETAQEPVQETALVSIRPDTDSKVTALYQEGVKLQQRAEARAIQSDNDVEDATGDLSLVAKLKKAIEEKRKEYIGPLNEHLKNVNNAFKAFAEPLNQADSVTRQKVLEYRAIQERVRQEQERINRLREEAARAETALKGEAMEPVGLVVVAPPPRARYQAEGGTLGRAKTWKFEVEDFKLLPDEFKLADMAKIRKVVTAGVTVPGVRAWQEESLRVTTR